MKTVFFLAFLFIFSDGTTIPGENIDGFSTRWYKTEEECQQRSKFLDDNPLPKAHNVNEIIHFCRKGEVTDDEFRLGVGISDVN